MRRRLLWGAAAAGLAVLLAAPVLLPFVDNLTASSEWRDHRSERRGQIELPLPAAAARLAPAAALLAFGDPRDGTWRGPENLIEVGGGAMGAAPLLLAVLAFAGGRGPLGRRRRRLALLLLAVGLVGLLVSAHLPGLSKPFGWLPLLRDSLLKRLSLWWVLAVSLLAALGVDRLRRGVRSWRTVLGAGVGGVAVVLLVAAVAQAAPEAVRVRLLAVELGGLGVLAAAFVAAALAVQSGKGCGRRRLWRWAPALALLMAAVVVPRAVLFARWVPAAAAWSFYPETLATRFVAERLGDLGRHGYRVAGLDAALVPHAAAFFGFEEARSYDPMGFAPYRSFLAALGELPRAGWVRILDPAQPALAFLGVRFVFDHPSMTARPGVEVAYHGRDAIVYENPTALPRLFVPRRLAVEGDPAAALAAARAIADFAALAVIDRAPGWAGGVPQGDEIANGAAVVTTLDVGRGRISATVDAAAPAVIASSQPAIPGWRLAVDGAQAADGALLTVNGAFLGVAVPAGRHEIELRYAPASWRLGLALGGVGLVAAAFLLLADRRRSRS